MTANEVKATQTMPLWFAAAGVAAIVVVNVILAAVLSNAVTERLLAREGAVKQEFLNSILAAEEHAGALFAQPAPSDVLVSFSTHVRSLPGIVRANIYSPDGYIRHSTEANLVGVHFADNDELAQSFKGQVMSAIETGEAYKQEHLALNLLEGEQLIEAYIPVLQADGKVAAVVEFYRKDPWVRDTVRTIERSIWVAGALSSLILVITMLLAMWASRRAKA